MARQSNPKKPNTSSTKRNKWTSEQLHEALKLAAAELENTDALSALKSQGLSSPLLLSGTQHIRVKRTIHWIRDKFFSTSTASSSFYFGQDLSSAKSIADIVGSFTNLSLFSQTQAIIIYEADKVKANAAKPLADAIETGSDTAFLILTAEKPDKKTPLLSRLPARTLNIEFAEMKPPMLRRWIEKEVRISGASGIDSDAAQLLIKCYGSDTTALSREISKLSLLINPGTKISRSLVEKISLKTPEAASFELLQQLARKNAARSVSMAGDLISQGFHPLQLNSFLSRCIRTLLAQKGTGAAESQFEGSSSPSELDNAWFIRNLRPVERMFSTSELIESLEVLKRLDFQLKDSQLPDSQSLALAIQHIALRRF